MRKEAENKIESKQQDYNTCTQLLLYTLYLQQHINKA